VRAGYGGVRRGVAGCGGVRRGAAGSHDERRAHDSAVGPSRHTRRPHRPKGRCREPPAGCPSPRAACPLLPGEPRRGKPYPGTTARTAHQKNIRGDRAALAAATADNRGAAAPRETSPGFRCNDPAPASAGTEGAPVPDPGSRGSRRGLSAWSIDSGVREPGCRKQPRGREPPRGGTASPRATRA